MFIFQIVHRRYRDFFSLHEELLDLCPVTRNIEFPRKKIIIRKTAKLVESRILALEKYVVS